MSDTKLSDSDLLHMAQSDSPEEREAAWRQIYIAYYPMVKLFVLDNQGGHDDSRDVFQEALAILHDNIVEGRFREKSSLKTYLFSISRNVWVNTLRNKKKEEITVKEMINDLGASLNNTLIDVEIIDVLMNDLKEDCRQVLTEYYFNSRSMNELMGIFNVKSIQAAKNKKYRCLNYIKKLFKERSIIPFGDNTNE